MPDLDLTKLSPAPWFYDRDRHEVMCAGEDGLVFDLDATMPDDPKVVADAEFCALARNAFDVVMRRGWFVVPLSDPPVTGWRVRTNMGGDMPLDFCIQEPRRGTFDNPFAALIAADEWLTREEARKKEQRDGC